MNHKELLHLWANHPSLSRTCGNLRFDRSRLFYYNTCIAQTFLVNSQRFAVFTSYGFPPLTSKVLGYAQRAWRGHGQAFTFSLGGYGSQGVEDTPDRVTVSRWANELAQHFQREKGRFDRARRWASFAYANIEEGLNVFEALANLFPYVRKGEAYRDTLAEFSPETLGAMREKLREGRIAREEQQAKRKAAQLAKLNERLPGWRKGEFRELPGAFDAPRVYLRLSADRRAVETSLGARVHLRDALRLFGLCNRAKVRPFGHVSSLHGAFPVGPYSLQSIDTEGNARVGCHFLTYEEMQGIHALLTPEEITTGGKEVL